jgi:hypothetical protein
MTPPDNSFDAWLDELIDKTIDWHGFYDEAIAGIPEEIERRNNRRLEVARLEQDRDAINKNLKAQHRVMIATLITALVALISAGTAIVIAFHSKPPVVYVRPNVIIKR